MSGAVLSLPHYAFMAWCLVKHMDNFTLLYVTQTLLNAETEKGNKNLTGR